MTAPAPGAIAILQLAGDIDPILAAISSGKDWPVGCVRRATPGEIDDCLVVRLDTHTAQLMPHGGPRVQQRLLSWLQELGVQPAADPIDGFPEARGPVEAAMLRTLATASSPAAIDLLVQQPRRWERLDDWTRDDEQRSARLNHLLRPPKVVMIGQPNVGKSTLLNTLAGRDRAIAFDAPGTTRDFISAEVQCAGLVVHWFDTPGIRQSGDAIEAEAILVAQRLVEDADLLLALADCDTDWPTTPRNPDLRIGTKADAGEHLDADLQVSALSGRGMADLITAVRDALIPPSDLENDRPWRFAPDLPLPT